MAGRSDGCCQSATGTRYKTTIQHVLLAHPPEHPSVNMPSNTPYQPTLSTHPPTHLIKPPYHPPPPLPPSTLRFVPSSHQRRHSTGRILRAPCHCCYCCWGYKYWVRVRGWARVRAWIRVESIICNRWFHSTRWCVDRNRVGRGDNRRPRASVHAPSLHWI